MEGNERKNLRIRELCELRGMVYNAIGDYSHPCDCLCELSAAHPGTFQDAGKVHEYIREAVLTQLRADGLV
jgi:hypothetical protein